MSKKRRRSSPCSVEKLIRQHGVPGLIEQIADVCFMRSKSHRVSGVVWKQYWETVNECALTLEYME